MFYLFPIFCLFFSFGATPWSGPTFVENPWNPNFHPRLVKAIITILDVFKIVENVSLRYDFEFQTECRPIIFCTYLISKQDECKDEICNCFWLSCPNVQQTNSTNKLLIPHARVKFVFSNYNSFLTHTIYQNKTKFLNLYLF